MADSRADDSPTPALTSSLIGHEEQRRWFGNAISSGRVGGSFLFVGPTGVGKRTFALALAQALLCEANADSPTIACEACEACAQVCAETHPDLLQVAKPKDRSYIPLELLIGSKENRNREGFCRDIRLSPFRGHRKVAILRDADFLNVEGANCLLKTLEEPPERAVMILVGTTAQKQLPTIRSRCRTIRFAPPVGEDAIRLIRLHLANEDRGWDDAAKEAMEERLNPERVAGALQFSGGDVPAAIAMLDPHADAFRNDLLDLLHDVHPDATRLATSVSNYVTEAGKDAPPRRRRMRQIFGIAVQHYRQQIRKSSELSAFYRLEATLQALDAVDRNANQATLIECWAANIDRGVEV